jgi:hypothetical protein
LSLDQILDTELNNNPQYADNSKAVPINVPTNKWFFNKKMLWIIAWIGLFLLAGIVVMSFSSKSSDKKPWTWITLDWDQVVEEYVDDHQVADSPEDLEGDFDMDEGLDEDYQWDTTIHESTVIVQQDFPDVDREDQENDVWNYEFWDIEPYVPDESDYSNGRDKDQAEILEVWDILPIILDYKSQAEIYYSQWDETQDKKLVKYSLQAIHLCDDYQAQIEKEELLDEEDFSSFKSKIEKIMKKMEEYLGWDSYSSDYYEL